MDKIISARVDEAVARRIGALAYQLRTSKKNIIEKAIELYAAQIDKKNQHDVFDHTFGAWQREESADTLLKQARSAFRDSMTRRQR